MNAPAPAAALTPEQQYRVIALNAIAPSTTHIQKKRRARFDKQALQDLADSIKATSGVVQPIVVRPHPKPSDLVQFELVAGERRWTASGMAAFTDIGAVIRELDDEQVLELQLIENLQREGLHEMDEAEGYEELMKLKKFTGEQIADKIGKSRRYVFNRLKLLDLCPEARKAFYDGAINASVALYIARVAHHDTQRQALKECLPDSDGVQPSAREAQRLISDNFMLELKNAPFDVKAVYMTAVRMGHSARPIGTACADCPKRTGNQKDLFSDIKSADVCTDIKCFNDKRDAHNLARINKARADGLKVITGGEAKKLFEWEGQRTPRGFDNADDSTWEFGNQSKKWSQLLGKNMPQPVLVEQPFTHQIIEVYRSDDLRQAAKDLGIKKVSGSSGSSSSNKSAELATRITVASNVKIFNAIHDKNIGRAYTIDDLRIVVERLWERLGFDGQKRLVDVINARANIPRAKGAGHDYVHQFFERAIKFEAAELNVLLLDLSLAHELGPYGQGKDLDTVAKRLGLNPTQIRADVKTEITDREKEKAKAVKAKGKKKGGAK
jgi:ParB/RepB/Spo0J family partition protein